MNKMPTLYKMTSKGKIQEWTISYDVTNDPFYSVEFGLQNGKLQTTRVNVSSGKNIGRSNETTPEEQCRQEAQSLWLKQIERKGYSQDIPVNKPRLPMLAKVYNKNKVNFPAFIQPKLDGIRCTIDPDPKSRTGNPFFNLDHIVTAAKKYNLPFDGELFNPNMTFQEIVSLVRKTTTVVNTTSIYYYVYDIVDTSNNFIDRYNCIANIDDTFIKVVPTYVVNSHEDVEKYHRQFISEGFEGSIIRQNGPYKLNGRSSDLLKKKDFIDNEFQIVSVQSGNGKYEQVPIFTLHTSNGDFEVVPTGSQEYRAQMLQDSAYLIGKMATVRYFELTDGGLPRFPVLVCIRDYE